MVPNQPIYTHTKDLKITLPPERRLIYVNPHDCAWK